MNWKTESENELRDFGDKKRALVNIPDIIKQIEYELSLLKNKDTVGRMDRNYIWEDLFIDNIMKKGELERNLLLTRHRINLIERGLNNINFSERKLLEIFYIERPDDYIKRLCNEYGCEKSSIYTKKDLALRKFTLAMYGLEAQAI